MRDRLGGPGGGTAGEWSRRGVLRAAAVAALPVLGMACTDRPPEPDPEHRPVPADNTFLIRGARADLVIVDGDPTTEVAATRDIVTVWENGYQLPDDGPISG